MTKEFEEETKNNLVINLRPTLYPQFFTLRFVITFVTQNKHCPQACLK